MQGEITLPMTLTAEMLTQTPGSAHFHLRDLWAHKDLLTVLSAEKSVTLPVKAHGVVMLKVTLGKK